jgi:hypothetical protein
MLALLISIVLILLLGMYGYKKSGMIKGSEEYYIKKFGLSEIKSVLVKAVAADAEFVPPEKTSEDFIDTDDYIEYQVELAKTKKVREETMTRSKPYIDKIKVWCSKYYDSFMDFINSKTEMVYYLDGSKVTPKKFYRTYMSDVSDEGKTLLLKVCKR